MVIPSESTAADSHPTPAVDWTARSRPIPVQPRTADHRAPPSTASGPLPPPPTCPRATPPACPLPPTACAPDSHSAPVSRGHGSTGTGTASRGPHPV
eukprot:13632-Rhodomonas_salina.1